MKKNILVIAVITVAIFSMPVFAAQASHDMDVSTEITEEYVQSRISGSSC
ncbi:MAG: hypothetical protein FWC34_02350 [Bacteroidetes bacterium]|nr:hypothetical protein [Bacteroidota bacterium]MCL2301717.1 hypothetical protein [Lentimicrobiaceae bacterium]